MAVIHGSSARVERLRLGVDLREALCGYAGPKANVMRHCPKEIHGGDDSTPSLSVSRQWWYCFGCRSGGDVFSWVMAVAGVDFHTAVEMVERGEIPLGTVSMGAGGSRAMHRTETWAAGFKAEWYSRDVARRAEWIRELSDGMSAAARAYYREKRFLSEAIIRGAVLGYWPGAYVIPAWTATGVLAGCKLRRDDSVHRDGPKYDSVEMPFVFGLERLNVAREEGFVVLTEGEFDALVVRTVGLPACTFTRGADSVQAWWKQVESGLRVNELAGIGRVVVCYDNDEAGRVGAAKAAAIIERFARVQIVELPEGVKDVTDFAVQGGLDAVKALLGKAVENTPRRWKRVWTRR